MLVVTRHRPAEGAAFVSAARSALATLRAQPGCESAELVRDIDDGDTYLLVTRWQGVGSYRRALSSFDVKVAAVPVLASAIDDASAFEVLISAEPDGLMEFTGDRAADADTASPQ